VITVAGRHGGRALAVQASTWDDRVFAAVALHPTRTSRFTDGRPSHAEGARRAPRVVAIGETGLDYYWDYSTPDDQRAAFRWHIELAKQVGKR